jgi:hypothetical protein
METAGGGETGGRNPAAAPVEPKTARPAAKIEPTAIQFAHEASIVASL